jgi:hypothetical protein
LARQPRYNAYNHIDPKHPDKPSAPYFVAQPQRVAHKIKTLHIQYLPPIKKQLIILISSIKTI